LSLPESEDIAKKIKDAMLLIEQYKPELKDSLPKDEYFKLYSPDDRTLQ
jgi:type I restriction enzyme M protein